MIYEYPLILECNLGELQFQKIGIDTDSQCGNLHGFECDLVFYLTQDQLHNLDEVKRIMKYSDVFDLYNDGHMRRKSDMCQDYKLYEVIDDNKQLALTLCNGMISQCIFDTEEPYICLHFDYWIIEKECNLSKYYVEIGIHNDINNQMDNFRTIDDNPHESIFEHNMKHSFLPYNWLKDHKITKDETFDWH